MVCCSIHIPEPNVWCIFQPSKITSTWPSPDHLPDGSTPPSQWEVWYFDNLGDDESQYLLSHLPVGWSFLTANCHLNPSLQADALLLRQIDRPFSSFVGDFVLKAGLVVSPICANAQNPASPPTAALLWIALLALEIQNTLRKASGILSYSIDS